MDCNSWWWRISLSIRVQTKLNHIRFFFTTTFNVKENVYFRAWPRSSPNETAGAFTICQQKQKIPVGKANVTAHFIGKFPKKMEILRRIPLFSFQPKWPEIPEPFVNSRSTRFTSVFFPPSNTADFWKWLLPFWFVIVFFKPRETRAWQKATPGKSCIIMGVPFQPNFPCKW